MFNQYGKHLEQATAAQVHAITWGEQENNQPPNPESSGDDGLVESNTDDQSQLSTKLTSCKTYIPSTSSEPSKVWNPSEESQTSHLSYGKTFLLTDKSTLVSWLRTVVGRILVPCANRLYGLVLTLQTYHAHYESRILQSGCFFDRISRSTPEPAIDIS